MILCSTKFFLTSLWWRQKYLKLFVLSILLLESCQLYSLYFFQSCVRKSCCKTNSPNFILNIHKNLCIFFLKKYLKPFLYLLFCCSKLCEKGVLFKTNSYKFIVNIHRNLHDIVFYLVEALTVTNFFQVLFVLETYTRTKDWVFWRLYPRKMEGKVD